MGASESESKARRRGAVEKARRLAKLLKVQANVIEGFEAGEIPGHTAAEIDRLVQRIEQAAASHRDVQPERDRKRSRGAVSKRARYTVVSAVVGANGDPLRGLKLLERWAPELAVRASRGDSFADAVRALGDDKSPYAPLRILLGSLGLDEVSKSVLALDLRTARKFANRSTVVSVRVVPAEEVDRGRAK